MRPYLIPLLFLGKVTPSSSGSNVYQKHQIRKVRNLRDRMLTSTGSADLFSSNGHSLPSDVLNPVRARQTTLISAKLTKEENEEDHTTELLKLPGFLENIGPDNFYLTNNKVMYNYTDNSFTEAVRNHLPSFPSSSLFFCV